MWEKQPGMTPFERTRHSLLEIFMQPSQFGQEIERNQPAPFVATGCFFGNLERAKGFEPSTPTLARLCSTPELHPHSSAARAFWLRDDP